MNDSVTQSVIEKEAFSGELNQTRKAIQTNGVWFVDIPRTSSSSIRVELAKQFGPLYSKTNLLEVEHAPTQETFPDHVPAAEMVTYLGRELWESLFTFTLIRNPWDRLVSLFNYRMKLAGSAAPNWRFEDYVNVLLEQAGTSPYFQYHGHYFGLCDFLFDVEGQLLVNFVGRFENREDDLHHIADNINCPGFGNLLLQRASPENQHYSEYYSERSREQVRQLYQRDIETFEYEFMKG